MEKYSILKNSIMCFLVGVSANVPADEFYADVLNSDIVAERNVSAGSNVASFAMSSVTTGVASHIKLSFQCDILGKNNHASNAVYFRDDQDEAILHVVGCIFAGVSDSESANIVGTRIIPIPVGTERIQLSASQSGIVSYSYNKSRVAIRYTQHC